MIERRHAQGFSMIELLVAVLVVGIGVLGVTGLQMVSLQNNRSALLRGEAVQLAYDMMDRIRANPTGAYDGLALGDAPPAAGNCLAADCSDAAMATFDQASWKCALGNFNDDAVCTGLRAAGALPPVAAQPGLPSGDGSIAVDAGTGVVTITVQWREPNVPNPTSIVIASQG
jgi:type IV pilus assembly protein PilV